MFFQEKQHKKKQLRSQQKNTQQQKSDNDSSLGELNISVQNVNDNSKIPNGINVLQFDKIKKERTKIGDKYIYSTYTGINPIPLKKNIMEKSGIKPDNKSMMSSYLKKIKNQVNNQSNRRNSISQTLTGQLNCNKYASSAHNQEKKNLNKNLIQKNQKGIQEVQSNDSSQLERERNILNNDQSQFFDPRLLLNSKEKLYLSTWKDWKFDFKRKNHLYQDPKKYSQAVQFKNSFNRKQSKLYDKQQEFILIDDKKIKLNKRFRDFDNLDISAKVYINGNLQGLYEGHILKDIQMQSNLVKSLINILLEKIHCIKDIIMEYENARQIFQSLTFQKRTEFNIKIEQTIIALEYLGYQFLKDLRENSEEIGVSQSPLIKYRELQQQNGFVLEDESGQRSRLFNQENFFKNSVDNNSTQRSPKSHQTVNQNSQDEQKLMQSQKQFFQNMMSQKSFEQNNQNYQNFLNGEEDDQVQEEQVNKNNDRYQLLYQEWLEKKYRNIQRQLVNFQNQRKKTQDGAVLKPQQYLNVNILFEEEEVLVFDDNIYLFEKITDFFKDCIEVFRIIQRQKLELSYINELQQQRILNIIIQCRMNLGYIYQQFEILKKTKQQAQKFEKLLQHGFNNRSQSSFTTKKIIEKELQQQNNIVKNPQEEDSRKLNYQEIQGNMKRERIHDLASKYIPRNKTSIGLAKIYNQDKQMQEDIELIRMAYNNDSKSQNLVDNRKKLKLQNMNSIFGSAQIQNALKIGKQIGVKNIPIDILRNI